MDTDQTSCDRISVISSMATRHVLTELADAYQRQCGQLVAIESIGGVDAFRRVRDGERFDLVVLAADAIDRLEASGSIKPGSRIDLTRSGVAIAVPAGARRPEIGDAQAIRQAILAARRIGYSSGPSGEHLRHLFEEWGITSIIAPRIVQPPPGIPVGTLVARGEVDLGFQQLSELMHLPGIEVIGSLPPEIQVVTVFSAATCSASNCPSTAEAFLSFLASSEADATKRRHGMEPA